MSKQGARSQNARRGLEDAEIRSVLGPMGASADFQVSVPYKPCGDQVTAIEQLTRGILDGEQHLSLIHI